MNVDLGAFYRQNIKILKLYCRQMSHDTNGEFARIYRKNNTSVNALYV